MSSGFSDAWCHSSFEETIISFNGTWITTATGAEQHIPPDGFDGEFKVINATTCELQIGEETFIGVLQVNGTIHWSDGDVWTRDQAVPFDFLPPASEHRK